MRTVNKRRRGVRTALALTIGFAMMGTALWRLPAAPSLLANSTRLAHVGECERMFWINAQEALIVRRSAQSAGRSVRVAQRLNTQTGVEIEPERLNCALARKPVNGEMRLSPDGKWLLWPTASPLLRSGQLVGYKQTTQIMRLDGLAAQERPLGGRITWMPDSQSWTSLGLVHDGTHVSLTQGSLRHTPDVLAFSAMPFTPPSLDHSPGAIQASLYSSEPLGLTHAGGLLLYDRMVNRPDPIAFYEINAQGNGTASRYWGIQPPHSGYVEAVTLSPQGDHLAWVVQSIETPLWTRLALTYLHRLAGEPQQRHSLYVSRLDGSDIRLIGYLERSAVMKSYAQWLTSYEPISKMQWTPDGRHISFIHQKDLYTVPVE